MSWASACCRPGPRPRSSSSSSSSSRASSSSSSSSSSSRFRAAAPAAGWAAPNRARCCRGRPPAPARRRPRRWRACPLALTLPWLSRPAACGAPATLPRQAASCARPAGQPCSSLQRSSARWGRRRPPRARPGARAPLPPSSPPSPSALPTPPATQRPPWAAPPPAAWASAAPAAAATAALAPRQPWLLPLRRRRRACRWWAAAAAVAAAAGATWWWCSRGGWRGWTSTWQRCGVGVRAPCWGPWR